MGSAFPPNTLPICLGKSVMQSVPRVVPGSILQRKSILFGAVLRRDLLPTDMPTPCCQNIPREAHSTSKPAATPSVAVYTVNARHMHMLDARAIKRDRVIFPAPKNDMYLTYITITFCLPYLAPLRGRNEVGRPSTDNYVPVPAWILVVGVALIYFHSVWPPCIC